MSLGDLHVSLGDLHNYVAGVTVLHVSLGDLHVLLGDLHVSQGSLTCRNRGERVSHSMTAPYRAVPARTAVPPSDFTQ